MDTYELGPFHLDTQSRMLPHGSEPVLLGRRAVALLRALVERPGALVSKDALIKAAWPGQAVEDSNLLVQIATLRRALGEAPGGERWIETTPRRGYRFIGPIAISKPPKSCRRETFRPIARKEAAAPSVANIARPGRAYALRPEGLLALTRLGGFLERPSRRGPAILCYARQSSA
jgi:DNA-binding winged helix-turn-helix (wHTH) protein